MINQSKDISWEEFNSAKEARIINLTQPGGRDKDFFYELIHETRDKQSVEIIESYCGVIESYEYDHGHLTKEQYLDHPYRVASLLLEQFPDIHDDYIKLALCHNIAEVSDITGIMKQELGIHIIGYVKKLTVNRDMQWDLEYKKSLYREIGKERITRLVKIYDKLDNMFVLSENPDKEIKIKYLEEITKNLLPFVIKDVHELQQTFETIIKFNYELIKKNS